MNEYAVFMTMTMETMQQLVRNTEFLSEFCSL
jgi:hypothetical protein